MSSLNAFGLLGFAIELRFISAELSFASELKSRFGKIQLE